MVASAVTPKTSALALLGVVSFVSPLLERWWTGRIEPLSSFDVVTTLASIPLIFFWYHVDKRQRDYQAGPLMNVGIVAVAILALPIYFIRSRGWKRGLISTLLAAGFFVVTLALSELGEQVGALLER